MKITFMGAGSTVFARNVLGDCMCTPALCEAEIALYDINEERLKDSEIILGAINKNVNESRATIKAAMIRAPSPTLRFRKNTVCVRLSQIHWGSAVSCVHFVLSR